MRSKTRFVSWGLLLGICVSSGLAQQPVKDQAAVKQAGGAPAGSVPQTETIPPPQPAHTSQPVNPAGYMEPAQVKALAQKIWAVEFRIHDLLTQVHPEKWRIANISRNSFYLMQDNLRKALEGLEGWRAQFEKRPDSMYFGFQTYAAINAALPRLDGVSRAASQFENPSLGAQFSQAGNQLFDLQQALEPYVAYLVRNPDQALYVAQSNLAECQNELGNALRGQGAPATPLKNTFVDLHARQHGGEHSDDRRSAADGKKRPAGTTDKKAEPQSQPH